MNVSLYQAAAAMNAQARWQELITENLSAGTVPGYRKREISFAAVQAGLDPSAGTRLNAEPYVIPAAQVVTNFAPGEVRATGNQLDFAIEGPAFFEVQLPNGARAYTRDGEFHLNHQGMLVTKAGFPVLTEDGPVLFDLSIPGPITVSPGGEISHGAETRGRLRLTEFNQPRLLTQIGDGCFVADRPGVGAVNAISSTVRQGALEGANTSPTAEMASLITTMRLFEANQRVLQAQDERMGRVISELGNPS